MDMSTGRIITPDDPGFREEIERLKNEGKGVEFDPKLMTRKQAETKQVSDKDTRSPLGKIYTSARKARKAAMKSGRRR